jgi:hypothetical protein
MYMEYMYLARGTDTCMSLLLHVDLLLPVGAVVVGRSEAAHLTNQLIESSFQRLASARTLFIRRRQVGGRILPVAAT